MSEQTKPQTPVANQTAATPAPAKGGLKPIFGVVKDNVTSKRYWFGVGTGVSLALLAWFGYKLYQKFKCKEVAPNNAKKN